MGGCLFSPNLEKMTPRERVRISVWRYTWECKCGSKGIKILSSRGVSKSIRQHLRLSPECCREDCRKIEVK